MSQAQRRLAALAAALGTAGAGALLLGGLPAGADTKTVSYQCTAGAGTGTGTTRQFTVNLSGPATAAAGGPYTATLVIAGQTPPLSAVDPIAPGSQIELVPQVEVSTAPTPATPSTVTATGSAPVASALEVGAPITPIPTVTVAVTPPVGATSMVLQARDLVLRVSLPGAAGTELYRCVIAAGGSTAPAAVTAAVTAPGGASPSTTPPSTPPTTPPPASSATPSASATPPQPTHTVEVTVTEEPKNGSKVARTPAGGAATGGGGDAGPDGRVFVLAGSLMLLGAAAGGVAMRRRLARG